jgi:outer membrane protein assembly factor BamD
MEKSDRDPMHALRAEQECKQLVVQFPNSKFAPQAQQRLRDIQEVLAEAEFRVGTLYQKKGSFPAAANRLQGVADQFPLYSKADEALWQLADSYHRMGDRFENQQVAAYQRIVKDYPLSPHVEDARAQLEVMKRPVPEADPAAYAHQKFELENRTKTGPMGRFWGMFSGKPDMAPASKSGAPQMEGLRPTIPASVPATAANNQLGTNEVTISQPGAANAALDKGEEVRATPATGDATTTPPAAADNTPPNANTPKPAAPGAITPTTSVSDTKMTPAQQKKAYQEQVKKMQQAAKVASNERKKKEAKQAEEVKAAKKKNREKQQQADQKQPDQKPTDQEQKKQ